MKLDTVTATRYCLPLREGGSLPAIVDTEDGEYVVKFRGAGQGARALVAETLAAGIASLLELPLPKAIVVKLAKGFGMGEPDPEIQDLLRGSVGLNFGLRYLPGALGFDPAADADAIDPELAAAIVWFDSLILNVDRTPRNANLLLWESRVWLIDHGASFYFHHGMPPETWASRAGDRFSLVREHILLGRAGSIGAADERLRPRLEAASIHAVVEAVPDEWLGVDPVTEREAYTTYLLQRLSGDRGWVEEAENARTGL